MIERRRAASTGQPAIWPVVLLLLIVVSLPSACAIWFLNESMRNERLAVRERLADGYRGRLVAAREAIVEHWRGVRAAIRESRDTGSPAERFARLVRAGAVESVIIRDASGRALYPGETRATSRDPAPPPGWERARRLEFDSTDPAAAAAEYERIIRGAPLAWQARAELARARCLARSDRRDEAIGVLASPEWRGRYRDALTEQGRLAAVDAGLRALELIADPDAARFRDIAGWLRGVLRDYGEARIPSGQRRHVMHALQDIDRPSARSFDTLAAEDLAVEFLEAGEAIRAEFWTLVTRNGDVVAIFRRDGLRARLNAIADAAIRRVSIPGEQIRVDLRPETDGPPEKPAFVDLACGDAMPGWKIELRLEGDDPLGAGASRRIATRVWIAALAVAATMAAVVLLALLARRQFRLTRMKNDLLATITHELKTPLSAMRALVETLATGTVRDPDAVREYLGMLAAENERLSRLVDNFLNYSRMERGRYRFDFRVADAGEIMRRAVDVVRQRFDSDGHALAVDVASALPCVRADADALVTGLVNLLDNAHKYTGDDKRVTARVRTCGDDGVCFEVEDNGVGMRSQDAKRIFERFTQIDSRLSREASGCGLGLSISRFIVEAHGGTVSVRSRPGEGSTFTIRVPAIPSESNVERGAIP